MTTEADLAAAVSAWLRADGWRTYHEVPFGGRIDIVAVRAGRLVWAIETKLRGGLDVLDQALERRRCGASAVLVACPRAKGGALARVAHELGVGVLEVTEGYGEKLEVRLTTWPEYHRKAGRDLLAVLRPEPERQAAGKPGGHAHWTPFKGYVRDFVEWIAGEAGPVTVAAAAEHPSLRAYKGDRQGPAMRRYLVWSIEQGLVPGVSLRGAGKTREVVFDAKAITAAQRRDYQLRLG